MGTVLLKSALYEEANWRPHDSQIDVLRSPARSKVVSAGRRFGKSELGAFDRLLPDAFFTYKNRAAIEESGKRWEYWIVGPEYGDGEKEFRKLYNAMRRLDMPFDAKGTVAEGIGTRYNVESGDMSISLWGGLYYVTVKSAKYPATLVGEGLRGVVLGEAAKLKANVYDKYIRPTLADYRGWLFASSTPEGKNWFYELWQRGQDPNREHWDSWKLPAWENPYVYPGGGSWESVEKIRAALRYKDHDLIRDLRRSGIIDEELFDLVEDLTEEKFNQEIGADFSEYVGRVFKDWDEEVHVTDLKLDPNPRWFTCAATDYGFTNPNVWLLIQVDVFGNVYVIDEYYERNKTIDEMAEEIAERGLCPPQCRTLFPDPEDPGSSRFLAKKLHLKVSGGTGGLIRDRVDLIRMALKFRHKHLPRWHSDNKPRLLVDRRCVNLIREMDAYRYPENKREQDINNPENPIKKDDHTPEALGRFFMGHFGVGSLSGRQTQISTATMRR
jgi:terminase large subunit-like protein